MYFSVWVVFFSDKVWKLIDGESKDRDEEGDRQRGVIDRFLPPRLTVINLTVETH